MPQYEPIIFPIRVSSSRASSISSSTWPHPRRFSIISQSPSSWQTFKRWRVKLSTALRQPSSSGTAWISFRVLVYRPIRTSLALGTTSNPTIPVVSFTFASNGREINRRNIFLSDSAEHRITPLLSGVLFHFRLSVGRRRTGTIRGCCRVIELDDG